MKGKGGGVHALRLARDTLEITAVDTSKASSLSWWAKPAASKKIMWFKCKHLCKARGDREKDREEERKTGPERKAQATHSA